MFKPLGYSFLMLGAGLLCGSAVAQDYQQLPDDFSSSPGAAVVPPPVEIPNALNQGTELLQRRDRRVYPPKPYVPKAYRDDSVEIPAMRTWDEDMKPLEVPPAGDYPGTVHLGYQLPGGYQGSIGSPYYYSAQGVQNRGPRDGVHGSPALYNSNPIGSPAADPHAYHFGPGYYRNREFGYYRFPYYSYRRPWYYPGFAGYNRDTNLPW